MSKAKEIGPEAERLYVEERLTVKQVAERVGASKPTVTLALAMRGIERRRGHRCGTGRPRGPRSEVVHAEGLRWAHEFRAGATSQEIADRVGLPLNRVRARMERAAWVEFLRAGEDGGQS